MPPKQEYDSLLPQQRRLLAIIRLNLKRSLPVKVKEGILECSICQKQVLGTENNLWIHFFITGCNTVQNGSDFLIHEGYVDIVDMAVKNFDFFLSVNEGILKKISSPSH